MKNKTLILFALVSILIFSLTITLKAQTADYIINDFDDNMPNREFFYTGPDNNKPKGIDSQIFTSDLNFIKEGNASRFLEWNNLEFGQYFGWGVNLNRFNASQVAYFSFWVIGTNTNERFEVKIKDINGREPIVPSAQVVTITKEWQKVKIPISSFRGANLSAIENINVGFNYVTSGKSGRIYVDDFRFEYQ